MLRHVVRGIAGLTAGVLAFTASPSAPPPSAPPPPRFTLEPSTEPVAHVRLETARDCDALLARIREIARTRSDDIERRWISIDVGMGTGAVSPGRAAAAGSVTPATAPVDPGPTLPMPMMVADEPAVVGTNVRDARVDEADVIKTDGSTIFVLRSRRLHAVDAASLELLDRLVIESSRGAHLEMLIVGDRIVVFEDTGDWRDPKVRLTIVDASDPSALNVSSRVTIDGELVAGRLVEGFIRIVSSSTPRLDVAPRDLTLADVVPTVTVRGATHDAQRAPCDQVYLPPDATSLRTTTVTSLDPADPEPVGAATALIDDGIVYATPTSLYIADPTWGRPGRTEVHRFDLSDPRDTAYMSSGVVRGQPLNEFSLDEHDGVLRIATTREGTRSTRFRGQSQVSVLREDGEVLSEIGMVDGLGVGERIYAVRFLGARGYVVTFRQIDPLYVLDLSDPTAPQVTGELKIPGFSEYLHPLDGDRLAGVGRHANGSVQVSLFDVADPTAPSRIATVDDLGSSSPIANDHRAFQLIAARNLMIVPTETSHWSARRKLAWRTERVPVSPADESDADAPGTQDPLQILDGRDPEPQPEAPEQPTYRTERVPYETWRYSHWTKARAHIIRIDADGMEVVGRVNHAQLARTSIAADPSCRRSWDCNERGVITRTIAIGDVLYALSDAGLTTTDLDSMLETDALIW